MDSLAPAQNIATQMEKACLTKVQQTELVEEGVEPELQTISKAICPLQCSGHGECSNGICQCDEGKHYTQISIHISVFFFISCHFHAI